MAQIASTVFPDKNKSLSFNQVQAIQLLTRSGDIKKFNDYCSSCKFTAAEYEECQNEVTVGSLNMGSHGRS